MEYGSIVFSDSQSELFTALQNSYRVIALVDDPRPYEAMAGVTTLSNLLPPASAITAEIDGNDPLARDIYASYLMNECGRSFGAILTAIHYGIDIMIYLPVEESMNFEFAQVFAEVFDIMYGITIGSSAADSIMHSNFEQQVAMADTMYMYDFIPFEFYATIMPPGFSPNPIVLNKLAQMIPYRFQSLEEAQKYIVEFIFHTRQRIETAQSTPVGQPSARQVMFMVDDNRAAMEQAIARNRQ